jgi:hypothetical protein
MRKTIASLWLLLTFGLALISAPGEQAAAQTKTRKIVISSGVAQSLIIHKAPAVSPPDLGF